VAFIYIYVPVPIVALDISLIVVEEVNLFVANTHHGVDVDEVQQSCGAAFFGPDYQGSRKALALRVGVTVWPA